MVKKGEILSQALSGVSDDLLDGARELFEKSEDDVIKTQELFRRKKQVVRRKMIYAMSAVAAACILIVLGRGITVLSGKGQIPEVYYDGVMLDERGVTAKVQNEPAVVSYSLERSAVLEESGFTLHIKARGSFTIEASGGELIPYGTSVMSASDEADIVWAVQPDEEAYLTVNAGTYSVKVSMCFDEETGEWKLRTQKGNN